MDPREAPHHAFSLGERVRLVLTLSVEDAHRLWDAAAAHAARGGWMEPEDVIATIGPREDPRIADCVAMLAVPPRLDGCTLEDVSITAHASRQAFDRQIGGALPFRA